MTSSILADMLMDSITVPHTYSAVVSHETRSTQRLLDKVQFFYDTMQPPKPEIGAESRSEKTFPEYHSSVYIGTAGARAFGRGDMIRKALLSELPFYEDPGKVLTGVEDAVPLSGELNIEATPNGEDNLFFERWTQAREGKSPYKPFFFPWWWTEDYQIPIGSEYSLPEDRGELTFTGEEVELIEKHHLIEAQIRWRRWKIAEKGGLFWQEFPEDEVSCFITIGDPVFDQFILNNLAQNCYEGTRHPEGWVYWIAPEKGKNYTIGVDTSAGAPGGSYSAAAVLDDDWRVCATFQARIEPHTFAELLKKMGTWYNMAELVVERNFTGYAVLSSLAGGVDLTHEGVGLANYPNIYRERDFLSGKITSKLGWWTMDSTRQYMMNRAKIMLPTVNLWDVNLVRQMRSFRFIKYKPTAQTFDDLAMAFMIAVAAKSVSGGSRGFRGSVPGWAW